MFVLSCHVLSIPHTLEGNGRFSWYSFFLSLSPKQIERQTTSKGSEGNREYFSRCSLLNHLEGPKEKGREQAKNIPSGYLT